MESSAVERPRIEVEQIACRPGSQSGEWIVSWSIANLAADPVTIESAWLPHGQFRGERTELHLSPTLERGASAQIELAVHYDEAAGTVVENAFLILTARWLDEPWRILVRLTIRSDDAGAPQAESETMTVQPVGFSEGRDPR